MKTTKSLLPPVKICLILIPLFLILSFFACDPENGLGNPDLTGTVSVDNMSPKVGDTLTASYASGNGTGTPIWQWLSGETEIANSNSNVYEVKENDLGKTLTARVSYTGFNGSRGVTTSAVAPADSGGSITYTAVQVGGIVGTATSTGISFTFSQSIDDLEIKIEDIAVSGAAVKGSATFTGSGTNWTLSTITVNEAGTAKVKITHEEIESVEKNVTVYKEGEVTPIYTITLSQTTIHTFTAQNEGYGEQAPLNVIITNTGNQPTGNLTVALLGANPESFELSKTLIDSIAVSSNDTFTVKPKTELVANPYTATVTVSGENITPVSFDVSFTVNSSGVTEYWNITWHLRGGAWDGDEPPTQVEKGTTLTKPTDPIKNNADFVKWYTDSALTQEFTFGTVTQDLNLYARWQQINPMFWWGNFIPQSQIVAGITSQSVFNLDELVEHRENARRRYDSDWDWDAMEAAWGEDEDKWNEWADIFGNSQNIIINEDGSKRFFTSNGAELLGGEKFHKYALVGNLRWQEFKHRKVAERVNQNITWTSEQRGFFYFISPKEYGDIRIAQAGIDQYPGVAWHRHEVEIEGVDYYIYQFNVRTGPYVATHNFIFSN